MSLYGNNIEHPRMAVLWTQYIQIFPEERPRNPLKKYLTNLLGATDSDNDVLQGFLATECPYSAVQDLRAVSSRRDLLQRGSCQAGGGALSDSTNH